MSLNKGVTLDPREERENAGMHLGHAHFTFICFSSNRIVNDIIIMELPFAQFHPVACFNTSL